ncbi:MAG: sulfotransferase [Gammaproteobacteria bacterium]|jgi:Tfp pilus assembly protein PilF|nr:sulfotransferase [Gammaproteobacteria bacterium]
MAQLPTDITQLNNTGIEYIKNRQFQKAAQTFEAILKLMPDSYQALVNLGLSYIEINEFEKAATILRQCLHINPQMASLWRNVTLCQKYSSLDNPDFIKIDQLIKNPDLSEEDQTQLYFALGKIYLDTQHYGEAYQSYEQGNHLHAKVTPFRLATLQNQVSRAIKTFNADFFNKYAFEDTSQIQPIIIIGPSRSGKSLLETMLSQMPQIQAAGEVGISHLDLPIALDVQSFTIEQVQTIRNLYITRLKRDLPRESKYIIDTLPGNFIYIGLLATLFPRAKFIYCQRDAKDIALSMFFKYYAYGHGFTCHLQSIQSYMALYTRMMTHWSKVLAKKIYCVSYEDIIRHPNDTMQKIKCYLELNEEFIFDFSQLHTEGVGIWRHFEKYISPKTKIKQKNDEPDLQDLMTSAYQRFEEGDLQSAENICLSLLSKSKAYYLPYHVLGLIYFQQGQNDKAIYYLEQALQIAPHNKQLNLDLLHIKNQIKK